MLARLLEDWWSGGDHVNAVAQLQWSHVQHQKQLVQAKIQACPITGGAGVQLMLQGENTVHTSLCFLRI
jgi:hypothetical protein